MPRPERFSNIQALAWMNSIAEDDSGNESEGENICKDLDRESANSDQVQPTWEMISSDGSDSETDSDGLEQTDSASCQLVGSDSGSSDTSTAAEAHGDGLAPNTSKIGLVAKDGTKWEYIEFSSESRGKLQAQNVLTESRGLTRDANRMLDSPLSTFELFADNAMLTHVQQCTEAKAHRVKNSDEWKLPPSELKLLFPCCMYEEQYVERTQRFLSVGIKIEEYRFFQKPCVEIAFAKSRDFFDLTCGVQGYLDFKRINLLRFLPSWISLLKTVLFATNQEKLLQWTNNYSQLKPAADLHNIWPTNRTNSLSNFG